MLEQMLNATRESTLAEKAPCVGALFTSAVMEAETFAGSATYLGNGFVLTCRHVGQSSPTHLQIAGQTVKVAAVAGAFDERLDLQLLRAVELPPHDIPAIDFMRPWRNLGRTYDLGFASADCYKLQSTLHLGEPIQMNASAIQVLGGVPEGFSGGAALAEWEGRWFCAGVIRLGSNLLDEGVAAATTWYISAARVIEKLEEWKKLFSFESLAFGILDPLAESLHKYFGLLSAKCQALPAFFPTRIRAAEGPTFRSIRQRVRVVARNKHFNLWKAKMRESLIAEGMPLGTYSDYDPWHSKPEDRSLVSQQHFGDIGATTRGPRIIDWDSRSPREFSKTVVLGDPGFGKSWLLRHDAVECVLRSSKMLEAGASPEDIEIPIFASLPALEKRWQKQTNLAEAIASLTGDVFLGRYVLERMEKGGHSLRGAEIKLFLDAWDEVLPGQMFPDKQEQREPFRKELEAFSASWTGTITLTSRTAGYGNKPLHDGVEVELLAFEEPEIYLFVREWFQGHQSPNRPNYFMEQLNNHP